MRPVHLKIHGFTSFREPVDLAFAGLDRFAICGPTGAGKSSILDALTFGLFADAPRRGKGKIGDLISLGRKSFSIVFDFAIGEQIYRVTRVRRRKGAGDDQLERLSEQQPEPIVSGDSAVTETIENLLGLKYDHFTQAVFLPQGKFAEFLKAKPADRRQLLNELLRMLIYQRMCEQARIVKENQRNQLENIERRLIEDFRGVSPEALAELERRCEEQLRIQAEADRLLPTLREEWERLKQARLWTAEWEAKSAERQQYEIQRPQIDRARQELERAQRAAGVVPLLRQAEQALAAYARRQQEYRQALQQRDKMRLAHEATREALQRTQQAAESIPGLRARLAVLHQALGKVSLREQLTRQVRELQRRLTTLAEQRQATKLELEKLDHRIARLHQERMHAEAAVSQIGFQPDHFERLQSVYAEAISLRIERGRLGPLRQRMQADERAAQEAWQLAQQTEQSTQKAWSALDTLRKQLSETELALRTAQDTHAAAHLQSKLQIGQPCPVCRQKVGELPPKASVPELSQLERDVKTLQARSSKAEQTALQAQQQCAEKQALAKAAQERAQTSRADYESILQQLGRREQELALAVADLLTAVPSVDGIEERILSAYATAKTLQTQHEQANKKVEKLRRDSELLQRDHERCTSTLQRLQTEETQTQETLTRDTRALEEVHREIIETAGSTDPQSEAKRVERDIDRLESERTAAQQAEQRAAQEYRQTQQTLDFCQRELTTAQSQAETAQQTANRSLQEAGFADAEQAEMAYRQTEQIQALRSRIANYDTTIAALTRRLEELDSLLQGQRITAEQCKSAELAYEQCLQRRNQAEKEQALLSRQISDLHERLERIGQLQTELVQVRRQYQIYEKLARDLRTDHFQAYLLEETLTGLIQDASIQLGRLTSERYGLMFANDQIQVIDHDNASECRGVETLSGGETFLASLSLALALSNQVQATAGAVRLDCLFIDEGFGTLDPETLRTVSDAIRGLQVGGRMVGIITHVPELKEEFEQRLIVERTSAGSQIRREVV